MNVTVYNTYNFTMSLTLKEGQVGRFKLVKITVPVGTFMKMYDRYTECFEKIKREGGSCAKV